MVAVILCPGDSGGVLLIMAVPDAAAESMAEIGVSPAKFHKANLTVETEGRPNAGKSHPHGAEITATFDRGLRRFEVTTEYVKPIVQFGVTEMPLHSDTD